MKKQPPIDPPSSDADPKDGFDFIEYPSDFPFKAMCRVNSEGVAAATVIRNLVLEHVSESSILDSHSNLSRTGKFESITIKVRLKSRVELESIYATLAASPMVVMTL